MAWLSYASLARLSETRAWVDHTFNVLMCIKSVESDLKSAESGQRGYLLTGKDIYLEPYATSNRDVRQNLEQLKQLTPDNSLQQARLKELMPLVEERLRVLQRLIDLRQQQGQQAIK